jgi:hypothetical protein
MGTLPIFPNAALFATSFLGGVWVASPYSRNPNFDLHPKTLASILKQAGIRKEKNS